MNQSDIIKNNKYKIFKEQSKLLHNKVVAMQEGSHGKQIYV